MRCSLCTSPLTWDETTGFWRDDDDDPGDGYGGSADCGEAIRRGHTPGVHVPSGREPGLRFEDIRAEVDQLIDNGTVERAQIMDGNWHIKLPGEPGYLWSRLEVEAFVVGVRAGRGESQ